MALVEQLSLQSQKEQILVVVPCLNEERHIAQVLTNFATEAEHLDLKIVVADGGSTDQTLPIVRQLAANRTIVLMNNPKRIQAAGINEAVRQHGQQAGFLIRADAHATYPANYCETLLNVQRRTLADSVVVSMHTEGSTCMERAAAAAQNSILGNGGAAHRNQGSDCWVEHGHHALFRMDAFKAVTGYDETFSHNEDAELDNRLSGAGFRIFLTSEAEVTYYPRGSLVGLFQQYFNIGRGRARNLLKHTRRVKLRHLVLAGVAPAICLALLTPVAAIFALPTIMWALTCSLYGLLLGMRLREPCAMASGIAAMMMQAGWSFGFFRGLLSSLWGRWSSPDHPNDPASQAHVDGRNNQATS
jgi:succinoglycan biosynthesis protein ExoA